MRSGEISTLKKPGLHPIFERLLAKLLSHGLKRKNIKILKDLLLQLRGKGKLAQKNYLASFISIFEKLVLRVNLLEITQRGKKVSIPLPVTRSDAVSIFVLNLVKLIRKNNILLKDMGTYIFNLFEDAKNKRGALYAANVESYRVAKENSFATKWLYIVKNNKSKGVKRKIKNPYLI